MNDLIISREAALTEEAVWNISQSLGTAWGA
jgi:hypothetical protein